MNIPLSAFPAPLLRLILCGGKGLAPAWGPLADVDGAMCSWHPYRGEVFVSGDYTTTDPTLDAGSWSLPLDDASPWPARLAAVAAWMLNQPCRAAYIQPETPELFHSLVMMPADPMAVKMVLVGWCEDGINTLWGGVNLPTLPQHLQAHPPTIALLLALYDVPEIRARVESA